MKIDNSPASVAAAGQVPAAGRRTQDDAKLKAACREMEAVFLNMLLGEMRKSVPKGGLIDESSGEEIMRSMLDSELTKNMSQAGGIGLADMLYRQLSPKENRSRNKGQAPS
jgi:Rod binding protein